MPQLIAVVACLLILVSTATADATRTKIRRFAVLIGANDGGHDRATLRYAGTDAQKMARLVRDIGGVAAGDALLLKTSSRAAVMAGLTRMRARLRAARHPAVRTELVVYYSGHSDETGLMLSGARLSYRELRRQLRLMPADVNVAILDSCASGAFTRTKGGTKRPAFLVDESTRVKGYAYISSSSEDEVAQEADSIASSFFTHYLASGLRGAADTNRDRKVTLNEAYQYAFAKTVARTEHTVGRAQHPAYNMHLAGTGDLVMTDLRSTSATLSIGANVSGQLFVRDTKGNLVVELSKSPGRGVVLGLGAARYAVTLRGETGLHTATVSLAKGQTTRLAHNAFAAATLERTASRGASVPPQARKDVTRVTFRLSFVPPLSTSHDKTHATVALNVIAGLNHTTDGVEIGGIANVLTGELHGVQVAGVTNVVHGNARGIGIAGVSNVVRGTVRGSQIAGVVNFAGAHASGNQIAGAANHVGGNMRGLQIAGAVNYTGGRLHGGQVSGGVNVASEIRGAQIGIVNVAGRVEGLQLGVINIADRADASVGLINIARNGYHSLEAWTSDTTPAFVGVKLGGRRIYTLLSAGLDNEQYLFGGGIGLHTPRNGYYVDIDATAYTILDHDFGEAPDDLLAKLRFAVGYRLDRDFSLFGGASATAGLAFDGKPGTDQSPLKGKTFDRGRSVIRLTPGLFAGVSFQ